MTQRTDGHHDVAIVGGGIVGLATAHQLLLRRPDLRLAVVEKEDELAAHQTGHNSGVLHSGLYYKPGSLKASLCREGKEATERFAETHGIPFERCGKLVVALSMEELPRLTELRARGEANGLVGLEEVGVERIREIEPHAAGVRALHVPETGIIDFRRVALAYGDEVRTLGGEILLRCRLVGINRTRDGDLVLRTTGGEVRARNVITCAGLHSDRVAGMTGHAGNQRIIPFRGDYYTFTLEARPLVRGLLYPVPDPSFPFLGVHFTRRVDGAVWAGPNAVLAFAREGYGRLDISPRDLAGSLTYAGFWRLARPYLPTGLAEMWRDAWKPAFVSELRRYLPDLKSSQLSFGPSGVRAQSLASDGSLVDDFSLGEAPHLIHVRNAPSPAATAAPAIGRMLAERAIERFELH
jgi:(S)-2-hydroxyglutarate dehydrogenase